MSNPPRRSKTALALALLTGTALGGFALGHAGMAQPAPAVSTSATSSLNQAVSFGAIQPTPSPHLLPDFSNLVSQVSPAVVSVTAVLHPTEQATPFGVRTGEMEARGSGFLVHADGTIVTNNHVVRNASKVSVTLDSGKTYEAKVVGRDARTDLAVLKIDAGHPLPFIHLGDSAKVRAGQWVVAIGNPFGLGGTVTAGIVSALGRDIGNGPYDRFIQIDAPINEGNSGGPLITQDGNVVGVNTAILSPTGGSVGIGFAIPSDMVRNVVNQIVATGHVTRGYLGVEAQPVSAQLAPALHLTHDAKGALIAAVTANSPAAKAGLQPGDVVRSVNGTTISDAGALAREIADVQPGHQAKLAIVRNGKDRTIDVTVASVPGKASASHRGSIGVALASLSPELRDRLGLPADAQGAAVVEVRPNSPAEKAGLQPGDIVVGVGPEAVTSPAQAAHDIHQALRQGKSVALRIVRNGQARFVAVVPSGQTAPSQG